MYAFVESGRLSLRVMDEMLDSSQPNDRLLAARLLERAGSTARPMLGALRQARNDPDPRVATAADLAIKRIEYEIEHGPVGAEE